MDDEKLKQLEAILRAELQAIAFSGIAKENQSVAVSFYLTPSEKAKLDEHCAGIGISKFIRSLLLRSRPLAHRSPIPAVNRELYIELLRIGRNINQQTRALQAALQTIQPLPDLDPSITYTYLAELDALAMLLHQVRQNLVPVDHDEDDAIDSKNEA